MQLGTRAPVCPPHDFSVVEWVYERTAGLGPKSEASAAAPRFPREVIWYVTNTQNAERLLACTRCGETRALSTTV